VDKQVVQLTISVVSHGHKDAVIALAKQLANISQNTHIRLIITINSLAIEDFDRTVLDPSPQLEIQFLKNSVPLGFGANHNQAFEYCNSEYFCVLNPDITLPNNPFISLLNVFVTSVMGLAYPSQINAHDTLLDFERELVSPTSVGKRYLLGKRYESDRNKPVDWVNGAFMVFKSSVFRELGGFDERYFMYCEDVDICLRLQLAGYKLMRADATVIHHTQRQTLKNPKHLAWHIRSLLRLWNSTPYKEYKRKFIDARK
jgi:N-acetylglucosaminyl-diphospho-decaprenol L-rhamnosyltransferase